MPYINPNRRRVLERKIGSYYIHGAGELNYIISKTINDYLDNTDVFGYRKINEVIGVLECAKMELYRRIAVPYEEKKIEENGDVYTPKS